VDEESAGSNPKHGIWNDQIEAFAEPLVHCNFLPQGVMNDVLQLIVGEVEKRQLLGGHLQPNGPVVSTAFELGQISREIRKRRDLVDGQVKSVMRIGFGNDALEP
jgi:hypothetical protein